MKFNPGKFVATTSVLAVVTRQDIDAAIARHLEGDWGDVSDADKQRNDLALKNGGRLLSSYHARAKDGSEQPIKFLIITESDRSATTVLLPDDY